MKRRWLFALAVLLGICVISFLTDQRNRYYVAGETYLSGRAQFASVVIGSDAQTARQALRVAGFEESSQPTHLSNCGGHRIAEGATVVRFEDRTWRRGKLCFVELDGWVVAMNVNYGWQFIT